MKDGVAIIGVGESKYREPTSETIPEIVYVAVREALRDARLDMADIDYRVTASLDLFDGQPASNGLVAEVVGAVMNPEVRVAEDGLLACYHAYMLLRTGLYNTVLVVAHYKGSLVNHYAVSNWSFDPIYQQKLGLDFLSAAALQANWYMHRYGITQEECARVVAMNRSSGKKNPRSLGLAEVTIDDVLQSPLLAYPIKSLDAAPVCDGACALVLTSSQRKAKSSDKPVWIRGVGACQDAHYLGDRDLSKAASLIRASQQAYQMAGIKYPKKEIDVAELSEFFSYQELLWLEGLGFCNSGEAGRMLDEEITSKNGELWINPSGGVLSGVPYVVAGLNRLAEAVLQVRGEAEGCQVSGVRTALVQGTTGPVGQDHCVLIVSA
ncbi:MAG: thiolase family protein [Desulfobacteraceae bacterium]|nr:thiolase family protein [Desulfobacteraceae bacterium]